MAGKDTQRARLIAARPAADEESRGYMPRVPWRLIALGTLSVSTLTTGYWLSQRNKAEALRAQIVRVHQQELAEPARRYLELRKKLEDFVLEASSKKPESFADKRLRLSGLRAGKGLYLRLPAKSSHTRQAIARGADAMDGDAIPSCLGLAPTSARGLFEKGDFLTPRWIAQARKNDSVMSLRVTDTVLAHHIRADLPAVLNMLRSDWFLLVLQQGDNRRDDPVDVFLWDLRSNQRLLRGRVQAISCRCVFSPRTRRAGRGSRPIRSRAEARTIARSRRRSSSSPVRAWPASSTSSHHHRQCPCPSRREADRRRILLTHYE
jgi:hypothetical protein